MVNAVKHALLAAVLVATATARAADDLPDSRPLTVVELFTSEGCSSCPPADALIGELAHRDDVLALSHHVDYWDYLGWKDRFAAPASTARQRAYASELGLRYVYTPQVVVHGAHQVTGSDRQAVLDGIAGVRLDDAVPVDIRRAADGEVIVSIGAAPWREDATISGREDATIWLALFDRERVTRVGSGENHGRELKTFNVVRNFIRIGAWKGDPVSMTVPMPDARDGGELCAVILQARDSGRILGAARLAAIAN